MLGVVKGRRLLQVLSGQGQFSEIEQGTSPSIVSQQEESRVLQALGETRSCSLNSRAVCILPAVYKIPIVPKYPGRVEESSLSVDIIPVPGCRLVQLREPHSLWSPSRESLGQVVW